MKLYITAKSKGKSPPCSKTFGFMVPSHIVKCWKQHRTCHAVFSGFDTFVSNSFMKVLAEKCSDCYSIKKPWDTRCIFTLLFFQTEESHCGFHPVQYKAKRGRGWHNPDAGNKLGGYIWIRIFFCDLKIAASSQNMTVNLYSPDRIWQKIGQNLTGPVDREYFMTLLLC